MRTCTRCSRTTELDDFRYIASRDRYHSWCRSCEREARRNAPRRPRTSSPRGRAFGIEIELTGPSRDRILAELLLIGINVCSRSYAATNGNNWELKYDGSVGGEGLELVSPKLYGDAGMATVREVLDALNRAGATVNRTCGIHIHIDFRNKTILEMKNALLPIIRSQSVVFDMCAPSRRTNHYARPWSEYQAEQFEGLSNLAYVGGIGPRGIVNLHAYTRHGSIEFRSHGASTNANKITAWIRFLFAAVKWGEENNGARDHVMLPGASTGVVTMCDALGLSSTDTAQLARFVRAAENLKTSEYATVGA